MSGEKGHSWQLAVAGVGVLGSLRAQLLCACQPLSLSTQIHTLRART